MKKFLSVILILILSLTLLCACGNDDATTTTNNAGSTTTTNNNTDVSNAVTLNFSNATGKGAALTNETALTLFNEAASSDLLSSVTVTNVYDGNGTGGAFPSTSGLVKMGKRDTDGTLVLNFGDKKVIKIEIKCHDWYTMDEEHPTNSNTVSVNGSEAVLAPYTTDATYGTLEFILETSSNEITIVSDDRVFVSEIVVYFE